MDLWAAEQVIHHLPIDGDLLRLMGRDLPRHLAGQPADFPLQLANAGLPGVAGDDLREGVVGDRQLLGAHAVLAELAGDEILPRDLPLLPLGVPGEFDHFHPIEQRTRNVLDEVGRGDEEDFAQVERHTQVVVHEAVVLGRVEHLEQGARRVSLERDAQLVDFVEQEDRVLGAGLLHSLDDPARHGADVGTAVPADVRFVSRAAQGDADVLPSHRSGDRLGHRGLADAGRAHEEENGTLGPVVRIAGDVRGRHGGRGHRHVGRLAGRHRLGLLLHPLVTPVLGVLRGFLLHPELAHSQELEDPVLDVAESIVILVEDPLRFVQLEVLLAADVPGQLGDVLQEGPDDLRLHRLAADPAQPAELAVDLLARLGRQLEGLETLPQLLEVVPLVALAQLALDGLELLAEKHLPLPLAQFLLDLGLDVLLRVEHPDLTLDVHQHPPEPLLDAQRLQQHLALRRGDVDIACHQIGELAGLVDAGKHLLDHLVGKARLLSQLGRPRARLAVQGHERGILGAQRQHLLGLADDRLEVPLLVAIVNGDTPLLAMEEKLHPVQASLELADTRDRPDGVEHLWGDALDVLSLGYGKDQAIGCGQGRLDRAKGCGAAGPDRCGDARKEHDLAQGQDGQCESFGHFRNYSLTVPVVRGKGCRHEIALCLAPSVPHRAQCRRYLPTTYEYGRVPARGTGRSRPARVSEFRVTHCQFDHRDPASEHPPFSLRLPRGGRAYRLSAMLGSTTDAPSSAFHSIPAPQRWHRA